MKVYISNYRDHWISPYTILNKIFFWKKDYDAYELDTTPDWVDKISYGILHFLDFIHPRVEYVKIDGHDVWDMDSTLGLIILPMLKKLKEDKSGAPWTNDEDVPDHLKSCYAPRVQNEWDIDDFHFLRWNWILKEMIWSFEQYQDVNWEDQFHTDDVDDWDAHFKYEARIKNGFRLFGAYYSALWT